MGAATFMMAGLSPTTALGIGVAGGITTLVSKQGRDLATFSNEMALLDDDVKNAHLIRSRPASGRPPPCSGYHPADAQRSMQAKA